MHTLSHIYMYSLSLPTHTNTLTHSHKHSISPSFLLYPHLNLFIDEHGEFLSKNGNKQAPLMNQWVEVVCCVVCVCVCVCQREREYVSVCVFM
jgi:hypothetical protein